MLYQLGSSNLKSGWSSGRGEYWGSRGTGGEGGLLRGRGETFRGCREQPGQVAFGLLYINSFAVYLNKIKLMTLNQ